MDWAGLLRLGLGRLHLRPDEFWRLTPIELLLMAGLEPGEAPMGHARLHALMQRFPDRQAEGGDGTR